MMTRRPMKIAPDGVIPIPPWRERDLLLSFQQENGRCFATLSMTGTLFHQPVRVDLVRTCRTNSETRTKLCITSACSTESLPNTYTILWAAPRSTGQVRLRTHSLRIEDLMVVPSLVKLTYEGCGSPRMQRTVSRAITSSSSVGIT